MLYAARDIRVEERGFPTIVNPTDAIIHLPATCTCGSDLWPYRGIEAVEGPDSMGHEYVRCGKCTTTQRGRTSFLVDETSDYGGDTNENDDM